MNDPAYYWLRDDMLIPGRWVVGDPHGGPEWVDPSQFTDGRPVKDVPRLTFDLAHPGRTLDFSLATMGIAVVTRRAADVLASVCGPQVQLIQAAVEGYQEPFFIANATHNTDCVDERRSRDVQLWTEKDDRPDRTGDYQFIFKLMIDPGRAGSLDFFRVARYTVALIVSGRLKLAMENARLLGPKFEPVT